METVMMSAGSLSVMFLFFFQAEDGIRDGRVTGVQTCALPILRLLLGPAADGQLRLPRDRVRRPAAGLLAVRAGAPQAAGGRVLGTAAGVRQGEIGRASCRERG